MPHYKMDTGRVPPEPMMPKHWPTGLRYWVRKEGVIWGIYWTIRSRRINAVADAAYLQRCDEYQRDLAETLWEANAAKSEERS